jgi:hypothetical protein
VQTLQQKRKTSIPTQAKQPREENRSTSPRKRKSTSRSSSKESSTPLSMSKTSSTNTYTQNQRLSSLFKASLAHLTLQRKPIKDEPLPNMNLFSFVMVVLLEILVPKIS